MQSIRLNCLGQECLSVSWSKEKRLGIIAKPANLYYLVVQYNQNTLMTLLPDPKTIAVV